jgi:hypothetical protein
MLKALCLAGGIVAALLLLVFGLDLAVQFPFGRVVPMMDIGVVVCAVLLGYGSWSTLQEQK